MLRHPVLHKLTADHHHGLVQARHLKEVDIARVKGRVRAFLAAWRDEIAGHFVEEEGALLPAVCPPLAPDDPVIATMLAQHIVLRRLAGDLAEALAADDAEACVRLAREVGQRLEEHIRLEEHELFERIQEALSPAALQALGRQLRAWEAGAASAARGPASEEQSDGGD